MWQLVKGAAVTQLNKKPNTKSGASSLKLIRFLTHDKVLIENRACQLAGDECVTPVNFSKLITTFVNSTGLSVEKSRVTSQAKIRATQFLN